MTKSVNIIKLSVVIFFLILMNSCGIYSFSGASISPDVKTVTIKYFPNNAPLNPPTLSQTFTESLKDRFMSQTKLNMINNDGDLIIEGAIVDYSVTPVAIQGNERAALNRLTITVNVKFTNNKNEKQNFESNFSRYADYESTKTLSAVEQTLIKQITDALVDDIFNRTVINW